MVVDSNTIYPQCTAAVYTPNNCLISESRTHFKPKCHQPEKNDQPIQPTNQSNPTNQPFQKRQVFCGSLWCFFYKIFSMPPVSIPCSLRGRQRAEVWKSRSLFLKAKRSKFAGTDFEQATQWVGEIASINFFSPGVC